jgi:hypothetical protein
MECVALLVVVRPSRGQPSAAVCQRVCVINAVLSIAATALRPHGRQHIHIQLYVSSGKARSR